MDLDFRFEHRPDYIYVQCEGAYSLDDLLLMWDGLFERADSAGKSGLLVDFRNALVPTPSTLDRYDYGVEVARVQHEHNMRVVLAVVGNEPFVDPDRFAQVVGMNRNANARVCDDYDDAVSWLEEEISRNNRRPKA